MAPILSPKRCVPLAVFTLFLCVLYALMFKPKYDNSVNFEVSDGRNVTVKPVGYTHTLPGPIHTENVLHGLNQYRQTELSDVFISVKTARRFHKSRVDAILKSWFTLARNETYFVTDEGDEEFQEKTGGHLISTKCKATHDWPDLNCKLSAEYNAYLPTGKRWFCHFDDDNYVNIPLLVELLRKYNHSEDWYLGRPSLTHPWDRTVINGKKIEYWFGTGGAGLCISRALALKMMPHASGERFVETANSVHVGDDVVLGYIICYLLKKNLTVINQFHSHRENMASFKLDDLRNQITLGFSNKNVVQVKGFPETEDQTRFRSLHCFLFPTVKECEQLSSKDHITLGR